MAGTVRHLPPVLAVDAPEPNHHDHPMRVVTNDMAAGEAFDSEHRAAVQALFDSMAEGWHAHDVPERLVALEDALERCELPEGVLVELGAGTGIGTRVITRFRPVHAAIDLSAGMLAQAPPDLAPWTRADASRLPLADRSVDVLVLLNMLLFPAEVERVLAPSGTLVWVNTLGEATPIHLSAEAVVDALPGRWFADASRAGAGTWCVARRAASLS
ncbi:MAG: class I SAM-dependent methyltransferase [Acidimicrobiales bacterium]